MRSPITRITGLLVVGIAAAAVALRFATGANSPAPPLHGNSGGTLPLDVLTRTIPDSAPNARTAAPRTVSGRGG